MKFRLIWIGSNSDREFADAVDRYLSRIRHFYPVDVTELAPEKGRQSSNDVAIMRAESARLLASVPDRGYVVVLDERGQPHDSLKFSKWLERMTIEQPHGVTFVMGGDVGLAESVRQRADKLLSLSAMTLPHQLARVLLLEQIYRACTLMRNIPYHK
jgi:23S rRNA (pseudouridine1915-N3)-methyltransferase